MNSTWKWVGLMKWSGIDSGDTYDVMYRPEGEREKILSWFSCADSKYTFQRDQAQEWGWLKGEKTSPPFLSFSPLRSVLSFPLSASFINIVYKIFFLLVVNSSAGDCADLASAYSTLRSTSGSVRGQLTTSAYLHHKSLKISFWVCCKKWFSFIIGFVKCSKEGSEKRLSCLIFEHKGNYHSIYLEG